MAQTIHCDNPGCGEVADVLISNLATGDTKAFCAAHFNEFVVQYCEAIINAQQGAQEEEKPTEGNDAPPKNKGRKGPSKQNKTNVPTDENAEVTEMGDESKDGDEIDESEEE